MKPYPTALPAPKVYPATSDKRGALAAFLEAKGTATTEQLVQLRKKLIHPLEFLAALDYDAVLASDRYFLTPFIHHFLPEMEAPDEWDKRSALVRYKTLGPRTADHLNSKIYWSDALGSFSGLVDSSHVPGTFTRLFYQDSLFMSDTAMERRTNKEVLERAQGHVFIAGLGIGMLLPVLLKLSCVTKITVAENSQRIINYVGHAYQHPKLEIIHREVLTEKPNKSEVYDTIYLDIWPRISCDNLPDMNALLRAYRGRLRAGNPYAWIGAWTLDATRRANRRTGGGMIVPYHLLPGGNKTWPDEE